jgi:hypothetical protein
MTSKIDSTLDQLSQLEAPVTLTPDQIAEAVGGVALAASTSAMARPPIIWGFINPDIFNQQFEKIGATTAV